MKWYSIRKYILNIRAFSVDYSINYSKVNNTRNFTIKDGYVWKSMYDNAIIPNVPIHEYIWQDIDKWKNKTAIICCISNRSYTYATLRDHCFSFATNATALFNLNHGDAIAICLPNIPEYLIILLGSFEAGLKVTTINPNYSSAEISRLIEIVKPKLCIGTVNTYVNLKIAANMVKQVIPIVTIKENNDKNIPIGAIDFQEILHSKNICLNDFQNKSLTINPTNVCFLPFSSGTTGFPKGVLLSHTNIIACIELQNNITDKLKPNSEDVVLCCLPFFHVYGLFFSALSKLRLGCTIITLPSFSSEIFSQTIAKYDITYLHLIPSLISYLLNTNQLIDNHLNSLRVCSSAAMIIGKMDLEKFKFKLPNVKFYQLYGLTEGSPCISGLATNCDDYESIGVPCANTEAKIVSIDDGDHIGLDANEMGELYVRGPQIMKGYLNDITSTKKTIIGDGWLRTGDIGYYNSNGFFYITSRLKELIKVHGYQVAPAELEETLRQNVDVLEAGVIGISHPVKGEVPFAFVVRKPNTYISEKCLKDFVAQRLVSYKHLEGGIRFVDSLPKNAIGKILRKNLKEMY